MSVGQSLQKAYGPFPPSPDSRAKFKVSHRPKICYIFENKDPKDMFPGAKHANIQIQLKSNLPKEPTYATYIFEKPLV